VIALPSLGALDRAAGARIWLAAEPADMRCGFDRLAERARQVTEQDPQRLEIGVFKLPRIRAGERSQELRGSELAMLLDGIDVASVKRLPRYARETKAGLPATCSSL